MSTNYFQKLRRSLPTITHTFHTALDGIEREKKYVNLTSKVFKEVSNLNMTLVQFY
jgi:hypothetical protein